MLSSQATYIVILLEGYHESRVSKQGNGTDNIRHI